MPRAGLSRAVIAADAAELADENGWNQLTLAAVAARFGVRQPSLYKHVAGLGELRRDVSVLAGRELHEELTAAAVGKSGEEALQAMAEAYRAFAKKHPGRYNACVIAPPPGDIEYHQVADAVVQTVSAVLGGYGLTGDDAIHAIRGLRALMHGFVSLEAAGGFAMPQDLDESYRRLIAGYSRSLRDPRQSSTGPARLNSKTPVPPVTFGPS